VVALRSRRARTVTFTFALLAVAGGTCGALSACGADYTTLAAPDGATTLADALAGDGGNSRDATTGPQSDAATDARNSDAGPACDPSKPFGSAALVPGLDTLSSLVRLSYDELTAYRSMDAGNNLQDIFMQSRPKVSAPFGPPAHLDGIATPNAEEHPSISKDGLTLYFDRQVGTAQIFSTSRATTSDSFFDAASLTTVNGVPGANNRSPYVSFSGAVLVFMSDRGGANSHVWESQVEGGAFGPAFSIAAVNSAQNDEYPVISADGLTIYFASDRANGLGSVDIWVATRATTSSEFSPPTNVTELNTPAHDYPAWLSADGCRMYLVSDRDVDANALQVWMAKRPL
jgi:Tol biopolymer transport system component